MRSPPVSSRPGATGPAKKYSLSVVCVLRTQVTMTGSTTFAICARRAQATIFRHIHAFPAGLIETWLYWARKKYLLFGSLRSPNASNNDRLDNVCHLRSESASYHFPTYPNAPASLIETWRYWARKKNICARQSQRQAK